MRSSLPLSSADEPSSASPRPASASQNAGPAVFRRFGEGSPPAT
eukprot:CAMPEP_0119394746 /NCGR_PEP_ID=MMETSP1334-20130426/130605_1 /TAXON_ID=127549 /ORGANISM="Calcidiscus leptoporus, Strain RCC1130" /LENGTH=43 /DNA_ID= /DNA_START= /DNA_END= /DNA_ORIENTATION=